MQAAVLLAIVSFLCCLTLTPLVRRWSTKHRFLDYPDGERKLHGAPVPRTGGVAILLACVAALSVAAWSSIGAATAIDVRLFRGIFAAVLIVFAIGLCDDLFGL